MINAGAVMATLELDTAPFSKGIKQAELEANTIGTKCKNLGEGMIKYGKSMTKAVSVPIAGLGAGILKTSADFEAGMSNVQAIAGASAEDMKLLADKAKEMGSTTKFSATESSEALSYMAMAGWKTQDMLSGLPGVMNLAAASGEDLGLVADILTDGLSAFGLQAKDSGHFADVLAQASSNANTNVSMLGESFKYVAPVAGAMGYTIEDTAGVLGLMANAGIKASQSGTSLRGALLRLGSPSKETAKAMQDLNIEMFNADGTARPLMDVIDDLRYTFQGMTEEQKTTYAEMLFGKNAIAGMLAVLNTSDADFDKFINALDNAEGSAEKMANVMNDNLQGQLLLLKSNLEGVALKLGETLIPLAKKSIEKIDNIVTKFSELDPTMQETIVKVGLLAAAAGPLLIVGGKVAKGVSTIGSLTAILASKMVGLGSETIAVKGVVSGLSTGLGTSGLTGGLTASLGAMAPWVAGISVAGVAVYELGKYLNEASVESNVFEGEISETTQSVVGSFLEMTKEVESSMFALENGSIEITDSMKNGICENISEMKMKIIEELNAQEQESIESLRRTLDATNQYTEEEKNTIIENAKAGFEEKRKIIEDGNVEIQEILQTAAEEHRTLTQEECNEINSIIAGMKEEGIQTLSDTEQEALQIIENLKNQSNELTVEMVSDAIAKSSELKEQMIADAEETYTNTTDAIRNMKTDGSSEAEEMKKELIRHAEEQRKKAIEEAEEMHDRVVAEAQAQAGDLANAISSEDGRILSNWQRLKNAIESNPIIRRIKTITEEYHEKKGNRSELNGPVRFAKGTNFAAGGMSIVGEHGPELVYLPRGSRVQNDSETKNTIGNTKIENHFSIQATIRDEADVRKVARELNRLQQREMRNRGVVR